MKGTLMSRKRLFLHINLVFVVPACPMIPTRSAKDRSENPCCWVGHCIFHLTSRPHCSLYVYLFMNPNPHPGGKRPRFADPDNMRNNAPMNRSDMRWCAALSNLNFETTRDQVQSYLEEHGCLVTGVTMCEFKGRSTGKALVELQDEASCGTVRSRDSIVFNGRNLRVDIYDPAARLVALRNMPLRVTEAEVAKCLDGCDINWIRKKSDSCWLVKVGTDQCFFAAMCIPSVRMPRGAFIRVWSVNPGGGTKERSPRQPMNHQNQHHQNNHPNNPHPRMDRSPRDDRFHGSRNSFDGKYQGDDLAPFYKDEDELSPGQGDTRPVKYSRHSASTSNGPSLARSSSRDHPHPRNNGGMVPDERGAPYSKLAADSAREELKMRQEDEYNEMRKRHDEEWAELYDALDAGRKAAEVMAKYERPAKGWGRNDMDYRGGEQY